jgi:hypothetical protein
MGMTQMPFVTGEVEEEDMAVRIITKTPSQTQPDVQAVERAREAAPVQIRRTLSDAEFEKIAQRVRLKNAELMRRLA